MTADHRPITAPSDRYHHGKLKDGLVEAALSILKEEGLEGLTLRKVAARAGVSHAAPAHHFGDARGLLGAVAAEGYRKLHAALSRAVARADSGDDGGLSGLRATGVAYVTFALRNAALFRVMFHPSISNKSELSDLEQCSESAYLVLREAIETCQAKGTVRMEDKDALALTCWASVHGLAVLVVDDQLHGKGFMTKPETLAEIVASNILRGLRTEEEHGRTNKQEKREQERGGGEKKSKKRATALKKSVTTT